MRHAQLSKYSLCFFQSFFFNKTHVLFILCTTVTTIVSGLRLHPEISWTTIEKNVDGNILPERLTPMTSISSKSTPKFKKCEDEFKYELERDKHFASLSELPSPFPVDTFDIPKPLSKKCSSLMNWGNGKESPRIIFQIEVFNDVGIFKRVINRLSHPSHAFIVHVSMDVTTYTLKKLEKIAEDSSSSLVCILHYGYTVWSSSTLIQIIMSSMIWLVNFKENWDFFVTLSGSDYPLLDVSLLRDEIRAGGNKTWHISSDCPSVFASRFDYYFLTCQNDKKKIKKKKISGRPFWLKTLVPKMIRKKSHSSQSGAMFHRDIVDFLVHDDRARAAFMFFRLFGFAADEHYTATVFSLPELQPKLIKKDFSMMEWNKGRGTGTNGTKDGAHNTFLTLNEWSTIIQPALKKKVPFIRKFDSVKEKAVLDRIDSFSANNSTFTENASNSTLRGLRGIDNKVLQEILT